MNIKWIAFGWMAVFGVATGTAHAESTPRRQPIPGVPITVHQRIPDDLPEFSIHQRQLEMELEEARLEIRVLSERLDEAQTPEGRRLRAERRLERVEADRQRLDEEVRELRASLRETQASLREVETERDRALRDAQRAQDRLEREATRNTDRRSLRRAEPDPVPVAEFEDKIAAMQEALQALRAELAGQMELTAQYREFARTAAEETPPTAVAAVESDLIDQGLKAFEEGDLRRARRLLERAAREHEDDAALHGYLGAVYFSQGQHARAQRSLKRAVELNPVDPAMHFNLAVLLASLDPPDLQKASLHYQESLRLGGPTDGALQARINGD